MEAVADQFEFMDAVPSTDLKPGSIAWARSELKKFEELNIEHGCLLTGAQAAEILGVTRPAIRDLASRGKLTRFDLPLGSFYSGNEIKARLGAMRDKGGRPKLSLLAGLDRTP
jgi:predicted XRE-type DNA-binding protein